MGYLEGELTESERGSFAEHLARCPPCAGYLETYRETIALGRDALALCRETDFPEDLVAAILAARKLESP